MTLTRARFEDGMTYAEFRAAMKKNQERFDESERKVRLDEADLAVFRALPQPLNVAVIAEDWCGDVIANLPVLGRLAEESGKLNLRVFLRDENPDLMDQYMKDGKFKSIPVFVFMDQTFRELGVFVERPQAVTELRARKRLDIYRQHPEFGQPDGAIELLPDDVRARLQAMIAQMREDTRDAANAEVVRELREIVARAA